MLTARRGSENATVAERPFGSTTTEIKKMADAVHHDDLITSSTAKPGAVGW
jgi:hypothetical protein